MNVVVLGKNIDMLFFLLSENNETFEISNSNIKYIYFFTLNKSLWPFNKD